MSTLRRLILQPEEADSTVASQPVHFTVRSGRVKHARRLATRAYRQKTGEFLAEGPQSVREALRASAAIEVFATAAVTERYTDLLALSDAIDWHIVDDEVVTEISDSVSPQGVVARCRSVVQAMAPGSLSVQGFAVICVDIRDPGNAGAVIRCADAAGASAVIMAGDSVDALNPKTVRASVGSIFHIPIFVERDTAALVSLLRADGVQVLAADGQGDLGLFDTELDLLPATAWMMGNEAWGLPPQTRLLADQVVAVPIFGQAESLNLATAAAVCMYASARVQSQR